MDTTDLLMSMFWLCGLVVVIGACAGVFMVGSWVATRAHRKRLDWMAESGARPER